ncbi:MAG: hypothetical protein ACLP3R_01270 [Candidatus Korobacteraceae bacterium]|jgi:hypothetical protein
MPRGEKRPGAKYLGALGRKLLGYGQARAENRAAAIKEGPSAKPKLTPRQSTFLQGIATLKSQDQEALDAGYAPSVRPLAFNPESRALIDRDPRGGNLMGRVANVHLMCTRATGRPLQLTDSSPLAPFDSHPLTV